MNFRALFLAIVGALVAGFFALESFLYFQANGFAMLLPVKILICVSGIYVFWRNIRRVKQGETDDSHVDSA